MRGVIQVEPTSTIATALKVNNIRLNARNEIPDMSVKIALSNHQSRAAKLSDKSTSGVALILVLGALSLMLILAVSFAVSVRTERLAAGNYADSVRARRAGRAARDRRRCRSRRPARRRARSPAPRPAPNPGRRRW